MKRLKIFVSTPKKPDGLLKVTTEMEGYSKLAAFMGAYPEIAVVSRFADLNMGKILYLQAELFHLKSRLREIEKADNLSGDAKRMDCALDWVQLRNYAKFEEKPCHNAAPNQRMMLISEINTTLKEYSKLGDILRRVTTDNCTDDAVLQQNAMAQLETPTERNLAVLQNWMKDPNQGCVYLIGPDRIIWEDPDKLNLLVINARKNESLLSSWMSDGFIEWVHQKILFPAVSLTGQPE